MKKQKRNQTSSPPDGRRGARACLASYASSSAASASSAFTVCSNALCPASSAMRSISAGAYPPSLSAANLARRAAPALA